MGTVEKSFINEGILRIAIFFMLASLTFTVRNYIWVVAGIGLLATYSLVTGVVRLTRSDKKQADGQKGH